MYQRDAAQKELDNLKNGGEGYVPWSKYKYQKEINDTLNEQIKALDDQEKETNNKNTMLLKNLELTIKENELLT